MDEEDQFPNFSKFFEDMRKNASIKAGAIMFGEAQAAYFDTLRQHMGEEEAFNLTAHTTEVLLRAIAEASGPIVSALLQASFLWERFGMMEQQTDKEVPGGG